MPSTKIEVNHNKIARVTDLDELAAILHPRNKAHQKVFLAVFIELKWAEDQFLPALDPIADKYGLSRRVLETVRAKMRRLGLIDHVSRFNRQYGYREGWILSNKFPNTLRHLADLTHSLQQQKSTGQERKDRDAFRYL